jgi:hypothetical protein
LVKMYESQPAATRSSGYRVRYLIYTIEPVSR